MRGNKEPTAKSNAILDSRHLPRISWLRRFSIRAMLIVTPLVAIVLGMIAWLDRAWIGK
jgi:hypothetical protein